MQGSHKKSFFLARGRALVARQLKEITYFAAFRSFGLSRLNLGDLSLVVILYGTLEIGEQSLLFDLSKTVDKIEIIQKLTKSTYYQATLLQVLHNTNGVCAVEC